MIPSPNFSDRGEILSKFTPQPGHELLFDIVESSSEDFFVVAVKVQTVGSTQENAKRALVVAIEEQSDSYA